MPWISALAQFPTPASATLIVPIYDTSPDRPPRRRIISLGEPVRRPGAILYLVICQYDLLLLRIRRLGRLRFLPLVGLDQSAGLLLDPLRKRRPNSRYTRQLRQTLLLDIVDTLEPRIVEHTRPDPPDALQSHQFHQLLLHTFSNPDPEHLHRGQEILMTEQPAQLLRRKHQPLRPLDQPAKIARLNLPCLKDLILSKLVDPVGQDKGRLQL